MIAISESCYDCGCDIADGLGERRLAQMPTVADAWGWVKVCPVCAGRRQRRRLVLLGLVLVFVGALTLLVAYPLLS